MRILEIETFGRGGLTHYAYNLTCALAEAGNEVIFITAVDYELEDRPLPATARVLRAIGRFRPTTNLGRKLQTIYDAFAVAWQAYRLRPDIIHLHCTNSASFVYHFLLGLLRPPLVATAHVVTPHERIRFQDFIYRRIHQSCDFVIAHSEFDRARLITEFDVKPQQTTVIPHGEYGFFGRETERQDRGEAREKLGLSADHEVALFFGYIREYKGLDILLEAWPQVAEARPQARLVIAGDPVRLEASRREELEALAENVGAIHRFEYIPFDDVALYFSAADLLVMPYRHISQSGVLYLALSLGVPVVATRVGAIPEMLKDGESVLIVPPSSPEPLARTLVRGLSDASLREHLAKGGAEVAEMHSWPAIAAATEKVFSKIS